MAGSVRQPIDQSALEQYLASSAVPDIGPPLDIKQFSSGQSNPTYLITSVPTGVRYVLRKKPPGGLMSATAHKVEREYRIMSALGRPKLLGRPCVPVPKMCCLCEDKGVLGTPFYIMELLDGRHFDDFSLPGVEPAEREEMWHDAIRTLARLHAIDASEVGLGDLGKTSGFYTRQIDTWARICAAQAEVVDVETNERVGPLPHMDHLIGFFADESRQPRDRASLVHGDYKIDNIVFHKTEPRVIGIIDWEMSTIGNPLSDLANLMTSFYTALRQDPSPHPEFLPGATAGLPRPKRLLEWYLDSSAEAVSSDAKSSHSDGRTAQPVWDPRGADFEWAMAFSVFRLAAICHGIAARFARRQASGERAKAVAFERHSLAEFAWRLTQKRLTKSPRL